MDYTKEVEFTPEGFQKAVGSLDFLPPEAAGQLSAVRCIMAKMF